MIVNAVIAVLVFSAWAYMSFTVDRHGRFSAEGLWSLKYFTVLSNLLQGGVSLLSAAKLLRRLGVKRSPFTRGFVRLRYTASSSVALTFFTVLCFLGPVFGFEGMYVGTNYWFHLVVPLLAMADFCLIDREGTLSAADTRFAVLPMLLYGLLYVGNLKLNGVGSGAGSNDWYHFAVGGPAGAAAVFIALAAAGWGIAALMRLPRRRVRPISRGRDRPHEPDW